MARSARLPAPTFELESWASNYTGPLLILRLRHIAIVCPSLTQQALALAVKAARAGKDVNIYRSLLDLSKTLDQPIDLDEEWIAKQDDGNKRELARLEGELRGYKNNLIRESIRMGQEDLASHLLLTGGPQATNKEEKSQIQGYGAAYTAFGKMREFCTTPAHVAGMTLRLLYTALIQAVAVGSQGHFSSVSTQASRLSNSGIKAEEDVKLKPIAAASKGIAHLGQGLYREAASDFAQVDFALASNGAVQGFDFCRTCASANDIAIYGGLTALATMSREELNVAILAGNFRAFLELEPHLRKAITLFTTGKYRACLDLLWRYYSDWNLDVFLGASSVQGTHVDRLFYRIREKSIIAYFASFSQVSLASLAETFPSRHAGSISQVQVLESEVILMINAGSLDARLDVVNGVLLSPSQNLRSKTQHEAHQVGDQIERTLLQNLHKINISLARLELPSVKAHNEHAR